MTCLGWAYFLNREFDKSLILYRKATEIAKNPDSKSHCDILYLKSRCLIEMKSIDRASTFLNRILEKFPKEPIYKMTNAIVLVEMGQWKSALDSIEDCINLECDLSEIYCGLGIINERMFQKDEAEEAYKKAVKIDANNTLASRRMALLRKHKNKPRNIPNLIHLSFDITEIPFLTYQKWNA